MSFQYKLFNSLEMFNEYLKTQYKIFDLEKIEKEIHQNLLFFTCKQHTKIYKDCKDSELYFTYWDKNILVGYLKILCLNDYNTINGYFRTLISISVHDEYRGNGISKMLLKSYFEYCRGNTINDILYISPWTRSRI